MPSVLVTGAGRGIGLAITQHLAATGWDVIAGVRSKADAAAVVALAPQRISAVILDVTSDDDVQALSAALPDRLDAVVNDLPTSTKIIKTRGRAVIVAQGLSDEKYGMAVRLADTTLIEAVNRQLTALKESGAIEQLRTKWF